MIDLGVADVLAMAFSSSSSDEIKEELVNIEDQEIQTIENIHENIQCLRNAFSKILSDREKELLKQCHTTYQHRRERIQRHINNQVKTSGDHQSTETPISNPPSPSAIVNSDDGNIGNCERQESVSRLVDFLDLAPPLIIRNDTETFEKYITLLVAKIQLYGKETPVNRFVRNCPPKIDVPFREIVKPHARYCAIKKRHLYATSRQSPYLNYYDMDTGKMLGTMGGEFKKGRGIVPTQECLYVADAERCQFVKIPFDEQKPSKWFSKKGEGNGELHYPLGMEMFKDGKLYITSMETKRIVVFKPAPSPIDWQFDRNIRLPHKPYDIAFDSDGNIHVAFGDNIELVDRIYIFTMEGDRVGEYGIGEVKGPGGITLDKNGYRYVTEYSKEGRLVIFDPYGKMVSSSDLLDYPMGVCIDEDGSIYVASNCSHTVVCY